MPTPKKSTTPPPAGFKADAKPNRFWVFQEGSELFYLEGPERPETPEPTGERKVVYLASAPDKEHLDKFLARQVKAYRVTIRA
jgi:hypothetical protein